MMPSFLKEPNDIKATMITGYQVSFPSLTVVGSVT